MSRYAFTIAALALMVAGCAGARPAAETTPEAQPEPQPAETAPPEATAEQAAPAEPATAQGPYQRTEARRPAGVLAVAVVPNPLAFAQNVAAYAQNAKLPVPFTADSVGGLIQRALQSVGGAGLRIDAPAYMLFVDADMAERPLALVLPASDTEAVATSLRNDEPGIEVLTADGYVVAAEPPVMKQIADYAFTGLRAEPLPAHPTVVAYGPNLRAKYGAQLGMARAFVAGMKGSGDPEQALGASAIEMYLDLANQIETMEFSLEATAALASMTFAMTGAPGTTLAAFVDAQRPAEFSELAYLPQQGGAFVAAGRMDWRPVADMMTAFSQLAMAMQTGAEQTSDSTDWNALFEILQDEFAIAMSWDKSVAMVGSYRTGATDKARDKMVAWWNEFASSPTVDAKKTRIRKRKVRGKSVTEFEYALAQAPDDPEVAKMMNSIMGKPPYRTAIVALPGRIGFAGLAGARKQISALVSRSAKPSNADLPMWAALAKSRSESFAHVLDGSAIARAVIEEAEEPASAAEKIAKIPPGILIPQGLGFRDRKMSFRTSVPVGVAALIGQAAMSID